MRRRHKTPWLWIASVGALALAGPVLNGIVEWWDVQPDRSRCEFGRQLLVARGPAQEAALVVTEGPKTWVVASADGRPTNVIDAGAVDGARFFPVQVVRDCDTDGRQDLGGRLRRSALADARECDVILSSASGKVLWRSAERVVPPNAVDICVGFADDRDGDGLPEFVRWTGSAAEAEGPRLELISSRTGGIIASRPQGVDWHFHSGRRARFVADVNGDEHADIAVMDALRSTLLSGVDLSELHVLQNSNPSDAMQAYTFNAGNALELGDGLVWISFSTSAGPERLDCTSISDHRLRWSVAIPGGNSTDWGVVACGGDVNADGVNDVLVGWPLFMEDAVYVLSGRDGSLLRTDRASGYGNAHFGTDLVPLPDLDQDGVSEYAVSDLQGGNSNAGRVSIVSGRSGKHVDAFGAIRLAARSIGMR